MGEAPSTKEEWFERALDAFAEDRLDEAIEAYRRALRIDPGFSDALHGLARALRDRGDLDGAIEATRALVALDPDDVLAHTSLSILYQQKGLLQEAEQEGAKARVLGWKQQLREGKGG